MTAETLIDRARADDVGALRAALAIDPDAAAAVGSDGTDLLMQAAAAGAEACVGLLLEHGADAGRRDAAGRSAADHARAGGHDGLAQRLATDVVADRILR